MIQYRLQIWQVNFYSININNNTCHNRHNISRMMDWTCETARDESRHFLISKNLVHPEEEQVIEIGVVSRKLVISRPAGLEKIKLREKYLMLEQKSGHPNMSALTVQLSSYSWALEPFVTALAKINGVN